MPKPFYPAVSILIIASISCGRIEYFPDRENMYNGTRILAHSGLENPLGGNTVEGAMIALNMLDGVEIDIQTSSDNTLWMNHSSHLPSCGTFSEDCLVSHSDTEITEVDSCLGPEINFEKLESLFTQMGNRYTDRYISLDAKTWAPCGLNGINLIRTQNLFAQAVIDLTEKYNLGGQVMVESQNGDFLYYIKKNSDFIETYLTSFGDFELAVSRALSAGFTGISFQYKVKEDISKVQVDLIHRKGLKIQIWTVNDSADISNVLKMEPDFIQTDNINYFFR